jgi:hypothetical protein
VSSSKIGSLALPIHDALKDRRATEFAHTPRDPRRAANMMNLTQTKQRYIDTVLCFTVPHDVDGGVSALQAAGYGAQIHLELVDDGDAETRFVHVWQTTDADEPGAMAALHAFSEKVEAIVNPFGGGDPNGPGFTDDPSKLGPEWQVVA